MLESVRRHKGLIILGLLVTVAVVYGLWPKPIEVEVVKVWRGPMTISINEEGKTRVIDRFVISAPVAGYKRRFNYVVGDPVRKGDVLITLEPLRSSVLDPRSHAEAKARVAAAEAALKVAESKVKAARADARLANKDYARQKQLLKRKLISIADLDKAGAGKRRSDANLRSAEFAVKVARFELEAARTTLKYAATGKINDTNSVVKVNAPVSGQILKIHHKSEGVVNSGQALIEIGDPAALEVAIDVLSADAVRLKPGTRIEFKRWGGSEILDGVVRKVEPVGFTKVSALGVEEQRVWIIADITTPRKQWKKLGDNYAVDASFIVWRGRNVLQAPASSVFRYKGRWAVFVVRNNRAVLTPVTIGRRGGLSVEIMNGVKAGTLIVKHPDDKIENGTRLKTRH